MKYLIILLFTGCVTMPQPPNESEKPRELTGNISYYPKTRTGLALKNTIPTLWDGIGSSSCLVKTGGDYLPFENYGLGVACMSYLNVFEIDTDLVIAKFPDYSEVRVKIID